MKTEKPVFIDKPTLYERSSDPPQKCEWCDTGVLHQHVVLIDAGLTQYLQRHGPFKEDSE